MLCIIDIYIYMIECIIHIIFMLTETIGFPLDHGGLYFVCCLSISFCSFLTHDVHDFDAVL